MVESCPRCHREIQYSGERPRFCSFCGFSLVATVGDAPRYDSSTHDTQGYRDSSTASAVPEVIGRYRLVRRLGQGGMGSVYEAEELDSGRRVAVKLISADTALGPEAVRRFRQEGRLASSIAHPRCVFVLAADEEEGRPYIVMELMQGTTLDDLVRTQGPMQPAEAISRMLDVLEGLAEAHRLGLIHRDVKPNNCFLDADGRVKVGDFGLARSLASDTHLTRTGTFLGTVLYASPEQIKNDAVDQQTDVYSAASTLYYLLTGKAPFESSDAAAALARIVSEPAPSMLTYRPNLSRDLDRVVLRGLERDRERRWRTVDQFRDALLPYVPGRLPAPRRRIRLLAFLIDWLVIGLLESPISLGGMILQFAEISLNGWEDSWLVVHSDFLFVFAYFTILEAAFGCSFGKWFLRLRVVTADGSRPGWLRTAWRTLVFLCLLSLELVYDRVLMWVWAGTLIGDPWQLESLQESPWFYALAALVFLPWFVGLLLIISTMRRRNGYRTLHDLLSGTHLVRLPMIERAPTLRVDLPAWPDLGQHSDLPKSIGAYRVLGSVRWSETERVLLAEDPSLKRRVWLHLHRNEQRELTSERRAVNRITRLRWLASGQLEEWHWDAYVAQSGTSLPTFLGKIGRLPWWYARPLLRVLDNELIESSASGTLPTLQGVEQIWVRPGGHLQLLDFRVSAASAAQPVGPSDLLRDVAVYLLEGGKRQALQRHIAAPLPAHAARMFDRLLDAEERGDRLEAFREDLEQFREEAVAVTRVRRGLQLAFMNAFIGVGLVVLLLAGWIWELGLYRAVSERAEEYGRLSSVLQRDMQADALASIGQTNVLSPIIILAQIQSDLRQQREARAIQDGIELRKKAIFDSFNRYVRQGISALDRWLEQQRAERETQRGVARQRGPRYLELDPDRTPDVTRWLLIEMAIWPALWISSAFLFRGGISYYLSGITLVRANGRLAYRVQCLFRSLLVWAPIAGLLACSLYLEAEYWNRWQPVSESNWWLLAVSKALWWLTSTFLSGYIVLALWKPSRNVHDWLSGVYLVPR